MPGAIPQPAPLSPEQHRWEKSPTNPKITRRRGVGVEVILGRKEQSFQGHNDINLLTSLTTINTTPDLSTLKQKLETGLLALRFRRPECACTAAWDDLDIAPWIQYTPPESQTAAEEWALNTVHTHASPKDAVQVWEDIEKHRRAAGYPAPEKPVSVHVVANVPNEKTPLPPGTSVEILCKMNHLYWDGVSSRSFVGELLRELNLNLANKGGETSFKWGEEVKNLSIPVLDTMKLDVETARDEIITSRDDIIKSLNDSYGGWGTKFRSGSPIPKVITLDFSPEQSSAMIKAVKSTLGPKYTISHLGQAATALAMLEASPLATDIPDDQPFITPIAINGRRWLRDDLISTYNGMSQTCGSVRFNNVKSLIVDKHDIKAVVEALKKACIDTKVSFDRWLNNPYQLAAGIAVHTFEGKFLSDNPMPFKDVACPVFLSDGLNDRYLPKEIVGENPEKALMSVDKSIFYLNELNPFYCLRLESLHGVSTLSSTYNGGNYTYEEAESFLKSVAYYMTTFAENAQSLSS